MRPVTERSGDMHIWIHVCGSTHRSAAIFFMAPTTATTKQQQTSRGGKEQLTALCMPFAGHICMDVTADRPTKHMRMLASTYVAPTGRLSGNIIVHISLRLVRRVYKAS
jgi:hypothetical protein